MVTKTKITFTLDEQTIARLNDSAQRLGIPKSAVVREAIGDYHARIGKMSEVERRRMLADFDRLVPKIPLRPLEQVKRELAGITKARRCGGRKCTERHPL
jgi:predicted transcriptional regulator